MRKGSILLRGQMKEGSKSNNAIKEHSSWGEEKLYEMIFHIKHKEDEYLLQKDFENKHLLLKNATKQTHQDTYAGLLTELDAMMGITTASLYELTACVRQDKVAELNSGNAHFKVRRGIEQKTVRQIGT